MGQGVPPAHTGERSLPAEPARWVGHDALAYAVVVVAAFAAYWPSLRNGFVWDDPLVLRQLESIHSWRDLIIVPPEIPHYYYRPVVFITYLVDRWLGSGAATPFHASVVGLHALTSVVVCIFARRCLLTSPSTALVAALLFAVSPLHTESVAWMAGRSDVIACALLLVAILLFAQRDAPWAGWIGGVALLLALLAKEVAIAGVLLVPALYWLRFRNTAWQTLVPLVVATAGYVALRSVGLSGAAAGAAASPAVDHLPAALVGGLGVYLLHSLVPIGLSPLVSTAPTAVPYVLVGTLIPLVGVVAIYRWWPASRWPAAFLLLWFVLTLAPAFTVMFRVSASAPIADRYLYLPSVATSVLIAWGFTAATRRLRLPGVATALTAGVALIALTAATWSYQTVWRDDYAFWSAAAAAAPEDGLAQRELGSTLLALGRLDEAERVLSRALQLPADPTSAAMTHSNLGLVYRRMGRFDDAIAAMRAAIAIAPHPALYHNLGLTWMAKAEADQKAGNRAAVGADVRSARDALEAALAFEASAPQRGMLEQWSPAKTHALLGQVLTALGDRAGARAHLEASLQLQPSGPMADTVRRQLDALR